MAGNGRGNKAPRASGATTVTRAAGKAATRSEKTTPRAVYFPVELHKEIFKRATVARRSFSAHVVWMLQTMVDKGKKKPAGDE